MSKKSSNKKQKNIYIHFLVIGIILVLVGVFIQIPGGALTTYEILNGDSTDGYAFDNKYSSIDEYVGGDAYNYIIGASLVGGKIAGTMTTKTILVVGGLICLCFGLTLKFIQNNKKVLYHIPTAVTTPEEHIEPNEVITTVENIQNNEAIQTTIIHQEETDFINNEN